MSENLKLVSYIAQEFYRSMSSQLDHLIHPDFGFVINDSDVMCFKEYSARRQFLFLNADITYKNIRSENDIDFVADVKILSLTGKSALGTLTFTVQNGLLFRVNAQYDLNEQDFKKFFGEVFKGYKCA